MDIYIYIYIHNEITEGLPAKASGLGDCSWGRAPGRLAARAWTAQPCSIWFTRGSSGLLRTVLERFRIVFGPFSDRFGPFSDRFAPFFRRNRRRDVVFVVVIDRSPDRSIDRPIDRPIGRPIDRSIVMPRR